MPESLVIALPHKRYPVVVPLAFAAFNCNGQRQNMDELLQQLDDRRKTLGMSYQTLADHSGVSLATVRRILAEHDDGASLSNIWRVARALGTSLALDQEPPFQFLERQAEKKARWLVGLVQGTAGLEAQAVDEPTVEQMVRQTIHELMAGPRSRIWGATK